jgi:hypothetical protein
VKLLDAARLLVDPPNVLGANHLHEALASASTSLGTRAKRLNQYTPSDSPRHFM